ncbi:DUF1588 domain-containing protein [Corallococcus sp. AB004]|nr:DUF1588 domain-containing protein [Corallococcus sp. AB004]
MNRVLLLVGLLSLVACKGNIGPNTNDGGPNKPVDPVDPVDPVEPVGAACVVQSVLTHRCASCHGALPTQGATMPLRTLHDMRVSSAMDGKLSNAQRALTRMRDDASPMPPAPHERASAAERTALETWIKEGMPLCSGTDGPPVTVVPEPNLLEQSALFTCTEGVRSDAPTRIRRMNRREFTRNVGGSVERSWTGFSFYDNPLDPSAIEQYSSWATDETLDEATVELFLPVVGAAASPWTMNYPDGNRMERVFTNNRFSCMFNDANPSDTCKRFHLGQMLEFGVFFRPPTEDELTRLTAFATSVIAQEPSQSPRNRADSITRISNAAWMMTGAMFRREMGGDPADGRVELTSLELGSQLAYALAGRAPSATPSFVWPYYSAPLEGHLADVAIAAKDGSLTQDATTTALLKKHLGGVDASQNGTPRFDLVQDYNEEQRSKRGQYWLGDGVAGFFREWLGYGHVSAVFKESPAATSRFELEGLGYISSVSYDNLLTNFHPLEPTFIQQFDDLIARVVVEDQDVLANLLTTRTFYVPSMQNAAYDSHKGLSHPYNVSEILPATVAGRWKSLPATERAGVLTHPVWLAAHGGNFEDDPSIVHRGKWVRENLLCGFVPPLSSVQVAAQVGAHAADKNARRRLQEATAGSQCQGCHRLMEPLGLPFEIYNHAGFLRARDHSPSGGWTTPDGSSTLTSMPDPALDGPVRDAVELSERLATSRHVKRCFVRQAFRYFMGRPENGSDACTLTQMEQSYDQNNGSFSKMLTTLMTSDTWKTRRVPQAGE